MKRPGHNGTSLRPLVTRLLLQAALVLGLATPAPAATNPLNQWYLRNPLPTGEDLLAVGYGHHTFVAASSFNLFTSRNGRTWTWVDQLNDDSVLSGVAWARNTFVAVGVHFGGGPAAIVAASPDGINWTNRRPGIDIACNDVAYGHDTFVAVGMGGVMSSSDGITWTRRHGGVQDNLGGVAYGQGTFVAVGAKGDGLILTSPDGLKWTRRNSGTASPLVGVAYGKDTFVAVG